MNVQLVKLEKNGSVARLGYNIIDTKTQKQIAHGILDYDIQESRIIDAETIRNRMNSDAFGVLLSAVRCEMHQ